jgi:hypothetical protein
LLRPCEFYHGICLTTEDKALKNLSQVKIDLSHLLPLLGAHHIFHVGKISVNIYRKLRFIHYVCKVKVRGFKDGTSNRFGPNSSRQDSTQAGTGDTNIDRGHTTTYQYRHMTKRAAEAW